MILTRLILRKLNKYFENDSEIKTYCIEKHIPINIE